MRILNSWKVVIIGLALVLLGQVTAVRFGWYEVDFVWFDLLLHFISGAILAIIWIIVSRANAPSSNRWIFILTAATFALFGSFVWELFEFFLQLFTPDLAENYSLNSPRISDLLTDMTAGVFGGLVWGYFSYKSRDKGEPKE